MILDSFHYAKSSLTRVFSKSFLFKALTQTLIKLNFAENIFNTYHTYINRETKLKSLHTLPKGPKLHTLKQHYK